MIALALMACTLLACSQPIKLSCDVKFERLRKAFSTTAGDPLFDTRVDFNKDGAINGLDFAELIEDCPAR